MKNISDFLTKRLQSLEAPFSSEWITDFSNLMKLIKTNRLTTQILKVVEKEKKEAHTPLICHLTALLEDGARCLKEIEAMRDTQNDVRPHIHTLLQFKIAPKELENPFFELESLYYGYYEKFVSLLHTLIQNDRNPFISKYCILSCSLPKLEGANHINLTLSFSQYFQKCKQDIEILSGQRATSNWGMWDVLLKWSEWVKNGISPSQSYLIKYSYNLLQ